MNAAGTPSESAAMARMTIRLLRTGRVVDVGSTLTTLVVLVLAIILPGGRFEPAQLIGLLAAILIFGLVQKFYAIRVTFDTGLFSDLAIALQNVPTAHTDAALVELDRALAALGLRSDSQVPPRSLLKRVGGAKRMLGMQILCFALQWLALGAASVIQQVSV